MWEYNYYHYNNDYLVHYGVKGMKWGHRKAMPYRDAYKARIRMAKEQYKTNTNRAFSKYEKGIANIEKGYKRGQNLSKKDQDREHALDQEYQRAEKNAKAAYKAERKAAKQEYKNSDEYKAKRAKAIKVGAAVVGTALAAYGTYKLAKYIQNKRNQAAMNQAQDYINKNFMEKIGETRFADGRVDMHFRNGHIQSAVMSGQRNQVGKSVGKHNAKVVATARQMYKDSTNTRLDKGLAKVVNTGDAVGNAAKRVGTNVKNVATKAKNGVLDVVNPIYEYQPGSTTSKTYNDPYGFGTKITETVTNYNRVKRKRR